MAGINIAVIDSGIDERIHNLGEPLQRINISPDLKICKGNIDEQFNDSHGTNVAAIIKKYYPNAIISDIKALSEDGKGNTQQFLRAIKWCVDNNVRLINLSLGTIDYTSFEEIRTMINYAYQRGVIIVAACNNKMIKTYPAALSNVIGVKRDRENILKEGQYMFNHYPLDGIEITACGSHKLKYYDGTETKLPPANSYAAPFITAEVGKLIEKHPSITLEQIKMKLEQKAENANEHKYYSFISRDISWVQKAVVFNLEEAKYKLNKENCFFEAVDVFNIKYKSLKEAYFGIARFIEADKKSMAEIDTIIINAEGASLEDTDYTLREFFKALSLYNKNIAYINQHSEKISCEALKHINTKLWTPQWIDRYISNDTTEIQAPIIAIYDFTGKGLLDTLLKLKNKFDASRYNTTAFSNIAAAIAMNIENIQADISEKSLRNMKAVYTINSSDLIILALDAEDMDRQNISIMEKSLEIDIRILISDNVDDSFDVSNINTIYLLDNDSHKDSKSENVRIFNLNEKDYAERLYQYIMELFENASE